MTIPPHSRIEVLESRIAPAMLFLDGSGATLQVFTLETPGPNGPTGGVVLPVNAAAAETGATLAIPLAAGDTLIYDVNGNHQLDPGDFPLVAVTAGHALVFATDFGNGLGGGVSDGHFEPNEITGLAVSNGFQAKISTDVNGSIITALDSSGNLTFVSGNGSGNGSVILQPASISALSVDGQVNGNIFAGNAINNVAVTGQHFNTGPDLRSVTGNIATGTAVLIDETHFQPLPLSFNGGSFDLAIAPFVQSPGVAGGSISNVRLDHGAHNLLAGDGAGSSVGPGGVGGSISNVFITSDSADPVWLSAGNGGTSAVASGGNGGSISGVNVRQTVAATDGFEFMAGSGGKSSGTFNGGVGGGILGSTIVSEGSMVNTFLVTGGKGGDAMGTGTAGAGGAISQSSIQVLGAGETVNSLLVTAGFGGTALTGHGGAGGSLLNDQIFTQATIGSASATSSYEVGAGDGGDGSVFGGSGGALTGDAIVFGGDIETSSQPLVHQPGLIHSGAGGNLEANSPSSAIAGKGGAITSLQLTQFDNATAGITLSAGDGGSASAAARGVGGAGGFITLLNIAGSDTGSTDLAVNAGDGGASAAGGGAGGAGGNFTKSSISEIATIHSLTLHAGAGGAGVGLGGAGGFFNVLQVSTGAVTAGVRILAGTGGASSNNVGGVGGAVMALNFENTGAVNDGIQVAAGAGGTGGGASAGGAGGLLSHLTVTNAGGASDQLNPVNSQIVVHAVDLASGAGGAGTNGAGGIGGDIARLVFQNLNSLASCSVVTGAGGAAGSSKGNGGAGGNFTNAVVNDATNQSTFDFSAGSGGESSTAHGGIGGGFANLAFNGISSELDLHAGVGGSAAARASGGIGGSIIGITGAMNIALFEAGAGGNNAGGGAGGLGGSVQEVNLTAIGQFVRAVKAGNGGNGQTAGGGGSVSGITVPGDIGDFTSDFDVLTDTSGMGGICAGEKGTGGGSATNGSVTHITATRIAAILAGTPAKNAVGYGNAVHKISAIVASVIGADVNGNGSFDFTEVPGKGDGVYEPDNADKPTDGDTALDGFVLVRNGGISGLLPVAPLLLIEV